MSCDYNAFGIFSVPLYVADLKPPTDSEVEFIQSLDYRLNYGGLNLTSNDDYVLNNLPSLKDQIEEHLATYVDEIIKSKHELSLYLTQSWINKNKNGTKHRKHMHTNSIVSGVIYFSENPQPISFFKHFDFLEPWQIEPAEYTKFNYKQWKFNPKQYQMIIFPSCLEHAVDENKTEIERMSLAFNTFFKGCLGSKTDMTYLELK
jgi:uncharacterized protein (TIGR02466 family)